MQMVEGACGGGGRQMGKGAGHEMVVVTGGEKVVKRKVVVMVVVEAGRVQVCSARVNSHAACPLWVTCSPQFTMEINTGEAIWLRPRGRGDWGSYWWGLGEGASHPGNKASP